MMTHENTGVIVSKEPCELCQEEGFDSAGDNIHVFESGVRYCIARHGTVGKSQSMAKLTPKKEHKMAKTQGLIDGEYANIVTRALTKKTCEFYGYMINKEKGVHIANYFDDAGNIVMQQLRDAEKNFPILGNKEYNETLWGLDKFTANKNVFLTITEGQIDAMSVAQAFDCKYPVVSLPNGAKSAAQVIQRNMHKLTGYKYVVLAFDNDKDGKTATEQCIKLFEPGYVRVAKWALKDANDLLKADRVAEIRQTIYSAVEYVPDPVITGQALLDSLNNYQSETREWPWKIANQKIAPIRIPALYTIAAKPQTGKTEFVSEIMRDVIQSGGKVGVVALEQTVQQVLLKLTSTITGIDLTNITNRDYTEEEKESCRKVADSIVIFDHITFGSDLKNIVDAVPYMVKVFGCKFIIFDNLSYSATSLSTDERLGIDKAMIAFKESTIRHNYTLFNVVHLKRDSGFDEGPDMDQIRGSQGVSMYSDYIIGLDRDISSESNKNILEAHVLKDRFSGQDTGKVFKLKFNTKTRQLGDL